MLHSYLRLLKDIRVIVVLSPDDRFAMGVSQRWLGRHFPRPSIGLLPSLAPPPLRELGVPLNYPHGSTARVFTELSPDLTSEARDAFVLSSCYLAPLLIFGDHWRPRFLPYSFWTRPFLTPLPEKQILRLIQKAQTAVADLFPYAHETFHTIKDYLHGEVQWEALDILREKRRILATQKLESLFGDLPESDRERDVLFAADPFQIIFHWLMKMKRNFVAELPWDDFSSTGLGFSLGILLTTEGMRTLPP